MCVCRRASPRASGQAGPWFVSCQRRATGAPLPPRGSSAPSPAIRPATRCLRRRRHTRAKTRAPWWSAACCSLNEPSGSSAISLRSRSMASGYRSPAVLVARMRSMRSAEPIDNGSGFRQGRVFATFVLIPIDHLEGRGRRCVAPVRLVSRLPSRHRGGGSRGQNTVARARGSGSGLHDRAGSAGTVAGLWRTQGSHPTNRTIRRSCVSPAGS